ncbi:MAG: ABC transporter permease [Acidobacteria bacterium]|nr:ABC transporter permease [Acidobacteriota bacterium]
MSEERDDKNAPAGWAALSSFGRNPVTAVGVVVLAVYFLAAVFAGLIAPRDPQKTSRESFRPPSAEHLFGTDDLGRDVFSGVVHGARVSLVMGFAVALLSVLVGVLVGSAAGYAGGLADDLLMRLTEVFIIPPRFFLALVVAALFGSNYVNLAAVLVVTYWPSTARLVRAEVLSLKERGYVEAARALGAGHARLLFHAILPNASPLIVTNFVMMVGMVVLVEAGLSFVGLGDSSHVSWGYMLHNGEHFMRDAWWMMFFPALAISLLVLALNAVGDALNRALDPKTRIAQPGKAT